MISVLFSLMLATAPISNCPIDDELCIEIEIQELIRRIEAKRRHADMPQCPMWVEDTFGVECV